MQSLRLLALISGLSALNFFFTGCSTAARTIEAATTKIEIQQGKNKGFSVAFPKELQATKLDVSIDPKSGAITIKVGCPANDERRTLRPSSSLNTPLS